MRAGGSRELEMNLSDARKAAFERAGNVVPDDARVPIDGDVSLEAVVDALVAETVEAL